MSSREPWGLLIEYEDLHEFLEATAKVRDAGFKRWDTHTPYPVHGLNDAMGLRLTRLPFVTLVCGLIGASVGLGLQWFTNAVHYPIIISGKPLFSVPANIPVTFEFTVLLAAIGTVVGMLAFNDLPLYYHPLLKHERFKRATTDRYYISIEADDPIYDPEETPRFAETLGGHVERVED